jgi:hypothetical protein
VLYAFGMDRIGVVVGDIYAIDEMAEPGQEGAENGVRLEVRLLERGELHGSADSAQPIGIGPLVWRLDLLEQIDSGPGSFDRTHHHPDAAGWEPGRRQYEPELSADPMRFIADKLSDLDQLIKLVGLDPSVASDDDAAALREVVPEIVDATRRLLARVHAGELATAPPNASELVSARTGWL